MEITKHAAQHFRRCIPLGDVDDLKEEPSQQRARDVDLFL
jgi:hypothetical protein